MTCLLDLRNSFLKSIYLGYETFLADIVMKGTYERKIYISVSLSGKVQMMTSNNT